MKGIYPFTRNELVKSRLLEFNWKSRFSKNKQSKAIQSSSFDQLKLKLLDNMKQNSSLATFNSLGVLYSLYREQTSSDVDFANHTRASYIVLKTDSKGRIQVPSVNLNRVEWILYKAEHNLTATLPISVYMPLLSAYILGKYDHMSLELASYLRERPRDERQLPIAAYAATPLSYTLRWHKIKDTESLFFGLEQILAGHAREFEYLLGSYLDAHMRDWASLRLGQRTRVLDIATERLKQVSLADAPEYLQNQIAKLGSKSGMQDTEAGRAFFRATGALHAADTSSSSLAKLCLDKNWKDIVFQFSDKLCSAGSNLGAENTAIILLALAHQNEADKVWSAVSHWLSNPAVAPSGIWKNLNLCKALAIACGPNFHPSKFDFAVAPLIFSSEAREHESKVYFSLLRGYSCLRDASSKRVVAEMMKQKQLARKADILETICLSEAASS